MNFSESLLAIRIFCNTLSVIEETFSFLANQEDKMDKNNQIPANAKSMRHSVHCPPSHSCESHLRVSLFWRSTQRKFDYKRLVSLIDYVMNIISKNIEILPAPNFSVSSA